MASWKKLLHEDSPTADFPTLNQATSGLAGTATALATPRAINGTDFDGTAAITVTAAGSTLSDDVTVANGGTGLSTLTANNVLIGEGTGNVSFVAPGSDGNVLTSDGTDWQSESPASSGIASVIADTTPQLGGQLDVNGNAIGDGTLELLTFTEVASAVNQVDIANAATGAGPTISVVGGDAHPNLNIKAKGTGNVVVSASTLIVNNPDSAKSGQLLLREAATDGTSLLTLKPSAMSIARSATFQDASGTVAYTADITGTNSNTNTGDEVAASLTVAGVIEIATAAETNTGTDATRAVSPDGLEDWTGSNSLVGSTGIVTVGALATGSIANGFTSISTSYTDAKVSSIIAGAGIDVDAATGDVTITGETASATNAGIVELATDAEAITGTDAARAVTPDNLGAWTGNTAITSVGTIGTGTWQGTTVAVDQGGTGVTTSTGTGNVVLSASPTFTGTVAAASLTLSGDLTVTGTSVIQNSTVETVSVADAMIKLRAGAVDLQDCGIVFERGSQAAVANGGIVETAARDACLWYDAETGHFQVGAVAITLNEDNDVVDNISAITGTEHIHQIALCSVSTSAGANDFAPIGSIHVDSDDDSGTPYIRVS